MAYETWDENFNNFDDGSGDNFIPRGNARQFADPVPNRPGTIVNRSTMSPQTRAGNLPNAEFNLSIDATDMTVPLLVELFGWQYNATKYGSDTGSGVYRPLDAGQGVTIKDATTPTPNTIYQGIGMLRPTTATEGTIYYDINGNLVYTRAGFAEALIISCQEIPYRALVDYTSSDSFKISRMRMQFSDTTQITQKVTWFKKDYLGKTITQDKSVLSNKSPDQFQEKIVDFVTPFHIDKESGLRYRMLAGVRVDITLFVSEWTSTRV